jgi:gamma-glutamylcyclotransferase (GGCT)/AIG2-like uncharacterized protein YtfP
METVNIFIYGTLKKGHQNSMLCCNATRWESCQIKGTMYDTKCGFPAIQLKGNNTIKTKKMVFLP